MARTQKHLPYSLHRAPFDNRRDRRQYHGEKRKWGNVTGLLLAKAAFANGVGVVATGASAVF